METFRLVLETFRYSTYPNLPVFDDQFMKITLLGTVKMSLRNLTTVGCTEQSSHVGSLRNFQVLTELHINCSLMVQNDCNLQGVLPVPLHKLQLDDKTIRQKSIYKRLIRHALSGNNLQALRLERVVLKTSQCIRLEKTYSYLSKIWREKRLLPTCPSHS